MTLLLATNGADVGELAGDGAMMKQTKKQSLTCPTLPYLCSGQQQHQRLYWMLEVLAMFALKPLTLLRRVLAVPHHLVQWCCSPRLLVAVCVIGAVVGAQGGAICAYVLWACRRLPSGLVFLVVCALYISVLHWMLLFKHAASSTSSAAHNRQHCRRYRLGGCGQQFSRLHPQRQQWLTNTSSSNRNSRWFEGGVGRSLMGQSLKKEL